MIKKIEKILLIIVLLISMIMLNTGYVNAKTITEKDVWNDFKTSFNKVLPANKKYTNTLYVGQRIETSPYTGVLMNIILKYWDESAKDEELAKCLENLDLSEDDFKVSLSTDNTNVIKTKASYSLSRTFSDKSKISESDDSKTLILAKKAGTANLTLKISYKNDTITRKIKVTVKKTTSSTKLDSSLNDVVNIVSPSKGIIDVLFAKGEVWRLDKKTFKVSSKKYGNVKQYINMYAGTWTKQNSGFSTTDESKTIITGRLSNAENLTIKTLKASKKITGIKTITPFGYLTKKGKLYTISSCDIKTGKVKTKLVASKVTSISGNTYVKNKKKYTINKNLTNPSKSYVFLNTGTSMALFGSSFDNVLKLSKSKAYLNNVQILNNVSKIYGVIGNDSNALIVRKDGSIWRLNIGENGELVGRKPSLTKVRTGKISAKKISKPTKVKAKKSGKRYVKVSWQKVSGASKYTVYRATKKNGTYKKIKTTTGSSYTDKSTKKKKTYYYKVVANHKNSKYNSNKTNAVKIKVK